MTQLPLFHKFKLIEVAETASTNKLVEDILLKEDIAEGSVYYTPVQTAGIGQTDNQWESEPFKNLTATVLLKPDFIDPADQFYLTVVVSLSVSDTVDFYLEDKKTAIKWPNDIYCEHRKIAGILIKNYITGSTISTSIAGVGLNINQTQFNFAPQAGSIKLLTGREHDIREVLTKWHDNLAYYYSKLKNERKNLLDLYLSRMYMRGIWANYLINDQIVNAEIIGVDKHGLLMLSDKRGKKFTCGLKEIIYPPL